MDNGEFIVSTDGDYGGGYHSANSLEVCRLGETYSARFEAMFRSYKCSAARSTLDLKAMSKAAAMLKGRY